MIINLLIRQQAQANAIPNKHFINTIIFDGKIGDDKKKTQTYDLLRIFSVGDL